MNDFQGLAVIADADVIPFQTKIPYHSEKILGKYIILKLDVFDQQTGQFIFIGTIQLKQFIIQNFNFLIHWQ